ncbi:MAG TPA: metal-dependent hydrolase, partial [Polyangiaceae bacterium]|nr:metal-dependent hydrolase [Polyangiaceae bacterium]
MFIGHFAVGFGSKRIAPDTPLTWLLVAPSFLDVLWPIFVLTGVERAAIDPGNTAFTPLDLAYMPWSHSLVMAVLWSILFALVYFAWRRDRRGALVLAAGVFSHWVLDWITHRPDMAIAPGIDTRVGLGLWNSIVGTLVVESTLFAIGVTLYLRATRAKDGIGRWALVGLVVFLLISYVGAAFGPPPPNIQTATMAALIATVVLTAWAAWIERHRASTCF